MINQNLENPSNDVLLFEHCAAVMALCLRASSQHQPCHQHLLLTTENIIRGKTPLTLKNPLRMKLPSYRYFRSFRNTCFLGFSFLLLKPKAVFSS